MRILIATDTTPTLFSGATTQLKTTIEGLRKLGHTVFIVDPRDFYSVESAKLQKGFQFALWPKKGLEDKILNFSAEAIHIYTECGVGIYMRNFCKKHNLRFSTSYLTRLDLILKTRFWIPSALTNYYMRWFHQGDVIMTVSHGIRFYLETIGCSPPIKVWHPGVHTEKFTFNPEKKINKNHPIFLYFGRIDKEKNLESFIELDLPGEKWILGSGGDFLELKHKYGNSVQFFEISSQEEINQLIQKGDVFVFPSKFDTFGIVLVEANAAGLPCATFNEAGPREVIKNRVSGILHEDLTIASLECLELSPKDCHEQAQHFSIEASVKKFFSSLVPI